MLSHFSGMSSRGLSTPLTSDTDSVAMNILYWILSLCDVLLYSHGKEIPVCYTHEYTPLGLKATAEHAHYTCVVNKRGGGLKIFTLTVIKHPPSCSSRTASALIRIEMYHVNCYHTETIWHVMLAESLARSSG